MSTIATRYLLVRWALTFTGCKLMLLREMETPRLLEVITADSYGRGYSPYLLWRQSAHFQVTLKIIALSSEEAW